MLKTVFETKISGYLGAASLGLWLMGVALDNIAFGAPVLIWFLTRTWYHDFRKSALR